MIRINLDEMLEIASDPFENAEPTSLRISDVIRKPESPVADKGESPPPGEAERRD